MPTNREHTIVEGHEVYNELWPRQCSTCYHYFQESDCVNVNRDSLYGNTWVCKNCVPRYVSTCDMCYMDRFWHQVHEVTDEDGVTHSYCDNCLEKLETYTRCSMCGGWIHQVNAIEVNRTYGVHHYCESCYNNMGPCAGCGESFFYDDMRYVEHLDDYLCSNCHYDMISSVIHGYCHKPAPEFYSVDDEDTALYLGMEWEIDNGGPQLECASRFYDIADEIYCKQDGSLSYHGIEVVTHPCTLAYHMQALPWSKLIANARHYGYEGSSNCGIHIHASRAFFGASRVRQDYNIAKVLLLVDRFWDEMVVFSRRNIHALEEYAEKLDMDILPEDNDHVIVQKANNTVLKGRFQAVNLENNATIEFRLFASTVQYNVLIATLQMVETICRVAKKISLYTAQNITWEEFAAKCTHPELKTYMTQRGLICAS